MHVLQRWQCVSVKDNGEGAGVSPTEAGLRRFQVWVVFLFCFHMAYHTRSAACASVCVRMWRPGFTSLIILECTSTLLRDGVGLSTY